MQDILYCIALRRLQSLAKVTAQPDPTKLVSMNFEAMLIAIENIAPNPALHIVHVALCGLYARHSGNLTSEQSQAVAAWEASAAGVTVARHLRKTLKTSWREIPAVAFGDSGSCNVFKKSAPSMVSYCAEWLKRSMGEIRSFVKAGDTAVNWLMTFEKGKGHDCPCCRDQSLRLRVPRRGWIRQCPIGCA